LAYSQPEFHVHHSYSDRRNWRVFDLVAPSRHFPSNSSLDTLPFSVKPDMPISHLDLFRIQRDHYEGTEFDLTKGLAAGSHGNPNRYDAGWASGVPIEFLIEGNFERAISIHRTSYAIVTQSRGWLPNEVGATVWFGAAQPHATCFVPFYPGATHISKSYQEGSLWKFRRESAWWAFASVGNWMEKNYKYMSQDIGLAQRRTEYTLSDERHGVETEATQLIRAGRVLEGRAKITAWGEKVAEQTAADWWALFEHLMTKYLNGARIDDFHIDIFSPTSLFYPFEWLKQVGYWPAHMDFTVSGPRPVHVTPQPREANDEDPPAKTSDGAPIPTPPSATPEPPAPETIDEAAQQKEKKHKKHWNNKDSSDSTTTLVSDVETPTMAATPVASPSSSSSSVGTVLGALVIFAAGMLCGRVLQKRQDSIGYSALSASE